MVRKILKWSDKKFEEALIEEDESKGLAKASLSGAVEGFVDGLAIIGLGSFIIGTIELVKDVIRR